ncbi:MAG TPA: rRNA maturation RNase YbeY [Microvirga sp.]|nr:rRNA maturation RNase YbeY [Microvirga sp.]
MSAPAVALEMSVEAGAWPEGGAMEDLARRAFTAALAAAADRPAGPVEISLLLTDDEGIRALNRQWRGKDGPTNVLSFPAPEQPGVPGPRLLGDVALAYETVRREAEAEGKRFEDHVAHLLVHGALHLLGYDHELEGQAEIMEALEVKALAALGIADPYRGMAA